MATKKEEPTYESILAQVKKENPDMKTKDQQKTASNKLKEYRAFAATKTPEAEAKPKKRALEERTISEESILRVEKHLLEGIVNRNDLIEAGRQVIPEGQIVSHGKSGVNTIVTWEDESGNRLPLKGFFYIYI